MFGSKVYYLYWDPERVMWNQRGQEEIFLWYSDESKAFQICLNKEREVIISRDVKFAEDLRTNQKAAALTQVNYSFLDHKPEEGHRLFDIGNNLPPEKGEIKQSESQQEDFRVSDHQGITQPARQVHVTYSKTKMESTKRKPGRPKGSRSKTGVKRRTLELVLKEDTESQSTEKKFTSSSRRRRIDWRRRVHIHVWNVD